MAYTTVDIVREESPFNNVSLIADSYIERSIDQADSYIDGWIIESYQLPLASTPSIIQHLSTTQAIIYLFLDQNVNIEVGNGIDVQAMQEHVDATLDSIRTRKLKLIDSQGNEFPTSGRWEPSFFPTVESTNSGQTPIKFKMDQQF